MKYLLILATLLVTGCATTNMPMTSDVKQQLPDHSLATTDRESPSFVAMTSTKGMLGAVGAVAAISDGNELVENENIEDPSNRIANTLAQKLAKQYGMTLVAPANEPTDSDDLAVIAKGLSGAAYAIDVQTTGWQFIYDGFNFSDYLVMYTAEMQLIDVAQEKAVATGHCVYNSKDVDGTVSYETLVDENAAYIKKQLAAASEKCTSEFSHKVLSL